MDIELYYIEWTDVAENAGYGHGPDTYCEAVVAATSAQEARVLMAQHAGDEGPDVWLSPHRSRCIPAIEAAEGASQILVKA